MTDRESVERVACKLEEASQFDFTENRRAMRCAAFFLRALLAQAEAAERENLKLRELLWLRHGCEGLYGDDGEMQCGQCLLDFKRDLVDVIEGRWRTAGERAVRAVREARP